MITIIDYGMGNIKSLANAFEALGQKVNFARTPREMKRASKLVFPGVGSFGKAMEILQKKELNLAIAENIGRKKPFLGICLGFQLLFEKSEESPGVRGLSVLKGETVKFRKGRIPHMGWNQIVLQNKSPLFVGIGNQSFVYFMHSFYVLPKEKEVAAATTNYGEDFCSAISSKNIFGVQFHPEKSGETGLRMLKNFIDLKC